MKKVILFIIGGCLSLYGFSVNPIDPPAKSGDNVITITPTSPVATNECSNLYSVVPVTVVVTIADCPDYVCLAPGPTCTIQLCIYEGYDCTGQLLRCVSFDPDTCTYNINVRANEGSYLSSQLVVTGCTNQWNTTCNQSSSTVPPGGGNVYINDQQFCP